MSDSDCNDFPSVYPQLYVNREAVIETVHGLQVDLALLADWLARDPEPVMYRRAVLSLAFLKRDLESYHPSLIRH